MFLIYFVLCVCFRKHVGGIHLIVSERVFLCIKAGFIMYKGRFIFIRINKRNSAYLYLLIAFLYLRSREGFHLLHHYMMITEGHLNVFL